MLGRLDGAGRNQFPGILSSTSKSVSTKNGEQRNHHEETPAARRQRRRHLAWRRTFPMIEVSCNQCRLLYRSQPGMKFRCKCGNWLHAFEQMVRFGCPACNTVMIVPVSRAGEKLDCEKCSQRLQIPSLKNTILAKPVAETAGPNVAAAPNATIDAEQPRPRRGPRRRSIDRNERESGIAHLGALTGVLGVALLTAGLFAPAWGGPFGLSMNFLKLHLPTQTHPDIQSMQWTPKAIEGFMILVTLVIAMLMGLIWATSRCYGAAGCCGCVALFVLAFAMFRIHSAQQDAARQIGEVNLLIGFQWGWGLLFGGGLLLLCTSFMPPAPRA